MADIDGIEEAVYEMEGWLTTGQVQKITGHARSTIIDWCKKFRKYDFGRQIGTRWKINPKVLELFLKGKLQR